MSYNKLPADPSAMTLGVIGLVIAFAGCCCGIFAVVSIVLGAIGLVMANKSLQEYAEHPDAFSRSSFSNVQTSKIINIVSIAVGSVITIAYILYFVFYGVLISQAFKQAYDNNHYDDYYEWENDSIYDDDDFNEVVEDTLNVETVEIDEFGNIEIKTDSINK